MIFKELVWAYSICKPINTVYPVNFTARNVIIPDKDLKPNEIGLGYVTFLELYKLEIISILINMLDIDHPTAWNIWKEATVNFNEQVYKIMNYMIKNRDIVCEINRNPKEIWAA